jgi:hypothetical protein
VALHCVVPVAVPDDPVLVLQVTRATPDASEAAPMKLSAASVVETDVELGEEIVSVGAVVSPGTGVVTF